MTIKEFAKKYGIPYKAAYEATFFVKPMSQKGRIKDFPEENILQNVIADIELQIDRRSKDLLCLQRRLADISHVAKTGEHIYDLSEMQ